MQEYLSLSKVPFLPELSLWLADPKSPWWTMHPDQLADTAYADPYWAFCWPGGAALARFLLDHPQRVRDRMVIDVGTGCGVVGLAAKKAGAREVVANDTDPWSLWVTRKNAEVNELSLTLNGENLVGQMFPESTILVLGDMLYAPEQSRDILAWCRDLKAKGCEILIADPRRGYGLPDSSALAWTTVASEIDPGDGRYRIEVGIWELTRPSFPSES